MPATFYDKHAVELCGAKAKHKLDADARRLFHLYVELVRQEQDDPASLAQRVLLSSNGLVTQSLVSNGAMGHDDPVRHLASLIRGQVKRARDNAEYAAEVASGVG